MPSIYRGRTPRGFSGRKDIGIKQQRFGDQLESFAALICGDRKERIELAAKHLFLKRQYPVITLPESIMYSWLEDRKLPFIYQATTSVESTPDFLIVDTGVAVLVNGLYFHQIAGARAEDLREVQALPGTFSDGIRIRAAVRVWEDQCYACNREIIFRAAVRGDEISSIYNRGL